jgi:carbon-monoxide dehydrogenase large subunit
MPSVMNAIIDVLVRETGLTHIDMPATPQRIWAALREGS